MRFLIFHEILQDKFHRLDGQLILLMLFRQVLNKSVFLIVCHTFTIHYLPITTDKRH